MRATGTCSSELAASTVAQLVEASNVVSHSCLRRLTRPLESFQRVFSVSSAAGASMAPDENTDRQASSADCGRRPGGGYCDRVRQLGLVRHEVSVSVEGPRAL